MAESPLALEARDRLGRAYARATLAVGESLLRAGDVPGAIHLYEHSLGLDDSREELYRALILLQANIGDTLAATQTYQRGRYSLRNRFGTAPSLATVRAWHESCRPHAGSGEGGNALAAYPATP